MPSSASRASAAAWRRPPLAAYWVLLDWLPAVKPWSGVRHVSPSTTVSADERHVELVGDELHRRREHAGAELDLAGEDRDGAVARDREPRVDQCRVDQRRADLRRLQRGERGPRVEQARERRGDEHRAGAGEELSRRSSVARHRFASPAALIAATIRKCVPQRQRYGSSPA